MNDFDAIIIGSGFGGLYALHHLRDDLGLSVRAFDGASGSVAPGGTTAIGARVDAPSSPFYAYTFDKALVDEWDWPETQASQPTVLSYRPEHFADRYDLRKDIQFEAWVTDARYDEVRQRWTIDLHTGETASAQFLVCAVGALFVANMPDIPGIDDFAGECHHTGRWPHESVAFEGKRVAVIGTGSSGIQAIPRSRRLPSTSPSSNARLSTRFARTKSTARGSRTRQVSRRLGELAHLHESPRRLAVPDHETACR